jgi:hypothetical protein
MLTSTTALFWTVLFAERPFALAPLGAGAGPAAAGAASVCTPAVDPLFVTLAR